MTKTRLGIIFGTLFFIIGASLFLFILKSQAVNSAILTPPKNLSNFSYVVPSNVKEITGQPTELIIPSLQMKLSIIPGYYDKQSQTWTLTTDKVEYATITPEPNNLEGNTFLYGHDRTAIFASLHTIQPKAEAIVMTNNNHSFYYQLSSIRTTTPLDDSVFSYRGKPILTLQTCTGVFYQYRQFFTFNLEKVV
ncbi:MAG TPA: sortase [Candidatus Saccharimonadia bacterium]|jgi:LPXTG-site transpeptidase (sortase) family protein|nr:sortase [Candidatus Saccharimonadia bacterium]